ncbi:MAG: phosphoribosylglycinamide formyltransferase [Bacteroidetes bacterium MED-G17]|nr:MAG: phosphoribosylglycinamide formyltransferase [Bacteroidetes bacterium TMED39]PDH52334.1 MAG: phosphoribosylglycinamide formyltransferase [Bacteroidetes bacterium MED-G17]CAI8261569.1 MAG: Phosphoribosylglycinamide formyltransferase [Bacteroidetes bacterium MED-G17]|tara:strand:+ start:4584 stop:5150 length:567 start_codon:yes stop_codon:yes gene_type:complete
MIRLAILASGSGTNAQAIIEYFDGHASIEISGVYTNNPEAGVIKKCQQLNMDCFVFSNADLKNDTLLKLLISSHVEGIILAGFLRKITPNILETYSNKIMNIHPSLLPKYGGKGMYGAHVHHSVLANKEKETGITIHLVNENYDEGDYLFQRRVKLGKDESIESIIKKISSLEHTYYPQVIERFFLIK